MVKKYQYDTDWAEDDEIIWVSKSEMKRDALHLKKLAEDLIALREADLAEMPLEDNIQQAIHLAHKLKLEARRRQIQYIAKLLRHIDYERVQEALTKVENRHNHYLIWQQKCERIRDQLISQGDEAINQLIIEYPQLERQHLRNLVRAAQKEQQSGQLGKHYRDIFQYLKTAME